MRLALAALVLPIASAAVAEDRGPGIPGERRGDAIVYPVAGFDRVISGGAAEVAVRVGTGHGVRVTGPAAAIARLRVVREGTTLVIQPRHSGRYEVNREDRQVRFVVTMPRAVAVTLGGSGRLSVDRVTGAAFAATLGGSGTLALGTVAATRLRLTVGGSGTMAAAGRADMLDVTVGGSGDVQAAGLRASRATVTIGGSGSVRADVDGDAQVTIAGSGGADLGDGARCRVTRVGSGTARCGG